MDWIRCKALYWDMQMWVWSVYSYTQTHGWIINIRGKVNAFNVYNNFFLKCALRSCMHFLVIYLIFGVDGIETCRSGWSLISADYVRRSERRKERNYGLDKSRNSSLAPGLQSKMGQQSGYGSEAFVLSESLQSGFDLGIWPQSCTFSISRPSAPFTHFVLPQNGFRSHSSPSLNVRHWVDA